MEPLRTFLEQQSLFSMFLVIGLGYAIGAMNIRGFALGIGAVLFVGLGVGIMAPRAPLPPCWARWACFVAGGEGRIGRS
jgi:putative transport protein